MKARYLICKDYTCISPYEGVAGIKEEMLKRSFLVVMQGDRFLGILSSEDILRHPRNLVLDCLVKRPAVKPSQSIESVLAQMKESRRSVLPVFDDAGFVGVIIRSDILAYFNEHKRQLEREVELRTAELQHLNRQLEQEIEERKKTETALQESEKRFLIAHKMEAIGMLAAGIAHDLNNILHPIIGFSDLLKMDMPPDNPLARYVDEIQRIALRGGDLVKQILSFSRQEEKEAELVRIQAVLEDVLKLVRPTLPATIKINMKIKPDCRPVKADQTHIQQIVMNLITKAHHALMESGGILSLRLDDVAEEKVSDEVSNQVSGPYICLAVEDSGTGIDPGIVDRIFDPFFTTKSPDKGTGLGLSVTYGIVKSYQGEIVVNSLPGRGTVFKIYLPAFERQKATITNAEESVSPNGTESVLLIDDEESIVRAGKKMLERLGYRVDARTKSMEALEAFKARPHEYDIVITDMTMPDMTGDILAGIFLQIRSEIPVILCTGFSEHITPEKARQIGIRGFIMKPVLIPELAKMMRRILDAPEDNGVPSQNFYTATSP